MVSGRLPLTVLVALTVAGCSLVSPGAPSFDDLEPGTFHFRARPYSGGGSWDTYDGGAAFHPTADSPWAGVYLDDGRLTELTIASDSFLTAEVGDRFAPSVLYTPSGGETRYYESGEVEITAVSAEAIEGRFAFLVRGGISSYARRIEVEGGFHVTRDE